MEALEQKASASQYSLRLMRHWFRRCPLSDAKLVPNDVPPHPEHCNKCGRLLHQVVRTRLTADTSGRYTGVIDAFRKVGACNAV